ncbi:Zinc-type alcohol dehydrogenase-like protein C16A3.02c [Apiospora phragmitis]|uniref:Zinc-type alcohol dehydrogenase-like protein C16A3.02c n=1 Tax=Apiospora phragmitis TaxID=2905665 RepID=A0ABR1VZF7_9PEZI
MRAWTVTRNGLELDAHRPAPSAAVTGNNLLLRVRYAGLNPADLALMSTIPSWLPWRRHPTAGLDFVGEVLTAGLGAQPPTLSKPGTLVCGALGVRQVFFGAGTLAEAIVVPADLVAAVPAQFLSSLSSTRTTEEGSGGKSECDNKHIRAAVGLGVAGQTAALVMREAEADGVGKVRTWDGLRVLVNGASGGVGSILVQVAKARGAYVNGLCSGANAEMVRRLGADMVIDYTAHQDLYRAIAESTQDHGVDLVVDCVGDDALYTRSPGYLRPDGRFLSIVGGASQGIYPFLMHQIRPVLLGGTPRHYKILGMAPSGAGAREVAGWIEKGDLREILVDSEFAMDEVLEAYEKVASKRARGKVVVRIGE